MQRYFIRIYIHHDKDLAILRRYYKIDLAKAVYCSMKAYLKGEVFVINLPEKRNKPLSPKRVFSSQLKLYEGKDDDLIELLESISSGNRNIFMKNLLRMYLCMPLLEEFFQDEDAAEQMIIKNAFRKGKRRANAADIKNWYKNGKKDTASETTKSEANNKDPKKMNSYIDEKSVYETTEEAKNNSQEFLNGKDISFTQESTAIEIPEADDDDLTALFTSLMQ